MPSVDHVPGRAGAPAPVDVANRTGWGDRDRNAGREIAVGAALVALVMAGAFYFAVRPRSTSFDRWIFAALPDIGRSALTSITWFSRPAVIIVGPVVLAALVYRRDRPRSIACLIGPILALSTSELVMKPAVGRTLGGALTYPSGSTVGAAALATAAVLAAPVRWRGVAAALASAYTLWMALAVVALRWHFPTDALAGVLYGLGVVLMVDGLAWRILRRVRHRGPERDVRPARVPRPGYQVGEPPIGEPVG